MNLNRKAWRWLHGELPGLVAAGVLTPEGAQKLRDHYGDPGEGFGAMRIATIALAMLGALLVGGGVILILAHNWDGLSRPVRVALSFAPLVVAQLLAFFVLLTGRGTAWREGVGIGLAAAVAASIALVGQTYHIYGDLEAFIFTWMLLVLPVVYLLNSSAAAAIYLAGITWWAGYVQWCGDEVLLYWPLFAAAIPHVWLAWRRDPLGPRAAWLGWILCFTLTSGAGIALEKALPGLWTIIYAALFATMYLAGRRWIHSDEGGWWRRPFHAFGACGTVVLGLTLSFTWPWDDVGWAYYHWSDGYSRLDAVADYALLVVLLGAAVALTVLAVMRRHFDRLWFGAFPLVVAAGYFGTAMVRDEMPAMLAVNLYLLALGIAIGLAGIRTLHLGLVNAGMLTVFSLILMRFFDSDFSFLARGVIFIALGLLFLVVNLMLARKLRNHAKLAKEG